MGKRANGNAGWTESYSREDMLGGGTCRLFAVAGTLYVRIVPCGRDQPIDVGMGVSPCKGGGAWAERLEAGGASEVFDFIGERYCVSVSRSSPGKAAVELRKTFTENVCSGIGVVKEPFARFDVELSGKPGKGSAVRASGKAVYAVSVASFYEDSGELTSYCDAFASPEEAADWFETDWNAQAEQLGGKKLTKKAKKAFLGELKGAAGIADAESPDKWGPWFKWHGVRKSL